MQFVTNSVSNRQGLRGDPKPPTQAMMSAHHIAGYLLEACYHMWEYSSGLVNNFNYSISRIYSLLSKIVSHSSFSRYISFTIYLDMMCIQVGSKRYVHRKVQTTKKLGQQGKDRPHSIILRSSSIEALTDRERSRKLVPRATRGSAPYRSDLYLCFEPSAPTRIRPPQVSPSHMHTTRGTNN